MLINGTAYDLIMVQSSDASTDNDDNNADVNNANEEGAQLVVQCSECMFRFGSITSSTSRITNDNDDDYVVYLVYVDPISGNVLQFPISRHNTIQQQQQTRKSTTTTTSSSSKHNHHNVQSKDTRDDVDEAVDLTKTIESLKISKDDDDGAADDDRPESHVQHDAVALTTLARKLQVGKPNAVRFILVSSSSSTNDNNTIGAAMSSNNNDDDPSILGIAHCNIFLWDISSTKLVIVDVDGTITKSTLTGFWNTAVLQKYSAQYCHDGVCHFLSTLQQQRNDNDNVVEPPTIQFVYLTNRPITYVNETRGLLTNLQQQQPPQSSNDNKSENHRLPPGPLIGFTGNLAGVFQMDFYYVNAHVFKYDTLQKYVIQPFQQLFRQRHRQQQLGRRAVDDGAAIVVDTVVSDLFYAGFGNTWYDMHAYHRAGIALHRMFIIDKQSNLYCLNGPTPMSCSSTVVGTKTLDQPKDYIKAQGTHFPRGYQDEKLIPLVLNLDDAS